MIAAEAGTMRISYFALLICAVPGVGVARAQPTSIPFQVDMATVSMGLTRTYCYGACPEYTVSIAGDGTVTWIGKRNVFVVGKHRAQISPAAAKRLFAAFRDADFLSAKPTDRAPIIDASSQIVTLTFAGQTHSIEEQDGLPDAVRSLEQQIDDTAQTQRWIKGSADTLAALEAERWDFSSASEDNLALYRSAIVQGNKAIFDKMVAARAPADVASPGKEAPVCAMTRRASPDWVERMIGQQNAFDPEVRQVCLSEAARSGRVEMLNFWIDRGADPAAAVPVVETAFGPTSENVLESAVDSLSLPMVRRVLEFPIDVHQIDVDLDAFDNDTLISHAVDRAGDEFERAETYVNYPPPPADVWEMIPMLAHAGATLKGAFFAQFLPVQGIRVLIAAGGDINERDWDGETPLMRQAYRKEIVAELLAAGADPTLVSKDGKTALSEARVTSCKECEDEILAAIQSRAAGGSTAKDSTR
jgi:hypothetical protein